MCSPVWRALALAAALVFHENIGRADESPGCSTVTRANVGACAARASLAARSEREGERAAAGRELSGRTLLPSRPVLAVSVARRAGEPEGTDLNWTATLSQELEIGGQRGARRRAAQAERIAQDKRARVAERDAAAEAWALYFELLAADEDRKILGRVESVARDVETATRAAADQGSTPAIEADLAGAAAIRVRQLRLAAERRAEGARAALTSLVGLDPAGTVVKVTGKLEPVDGVLEHARRALRDQGEARPEIEALDAERRAARARADLSRRSRIPNVTLSVFAAREGFGERVLGAGIAIPLPLPHPLATPETGQIAEAEAVGRRAGVESNRLSRDIRLRLVTGIRTYESRKSELDVFAPERRARAERTLDDVREQIAARRIGVRDALLIQQSLLDLLRAHIEARLGLCQASVDLGRASGFAFERGGR